MVSKNSSLPFLSGDLGVKGMPVIPTKKVEELEEFVGLLLAKPELLHNPELKFFKDYLLGLGAKLPGAAGAHTFHSGKQCY